MKWSRFDYLYLFLIFITAVVTVFDLFFSPGRPATFDSPFHITNIAQFSSALKDGDFPVVWSDGFGNYGLPIPIVAHQLTSYLGGFLLFFIKSPELAYDILIFIGILFSCVFYYFFLRVYFTPAIAFLATYLFNFSSYRLLNIYIRGAMPEIFSAIFLPLILIGIYFLIEKKNINALILIIFSLFGLSLNHPMMILIYSFVFIPYLVFVLVKNGLFSRKKMLSVLNGKLLIAAIVAMVVGIGMASYYIVPLVLEIKYFYYGLTKNHLTPDSYLNFSNYFNPSWYYFTQNDIFTRGHVIKTGILETLAITGGVFYVLWNFLLKRRKKFSLLEFTVFTSILIIFFTSEYAAVFYNNISALSNIQFPWRMLSALIFIPPIIAAYFFQKIKSNIPIFLFVLLISIMNFPQIYGKNFTVYKKDIYFFTTQNVHSVLMNTIWTGKTEDYPVKKNKGEIIEGKGKIISASEKNSERNYIVSADTPLKMVDNTFYFPGWNVYVDGKAVPIEYQNPEYRGVITYNVPAGQHTIAARFEDTKVRFFGKILSIFFIFLFLTIFFLRKKIGILLYKDNT